MHITKVEYSELYTFDYNNYKLGAVSNVGIGEDPDKVLSDLKKYVQKKLKEDHDNYMSSNDKIQEKYLEIVMLEHKARLLMDGIRYQEKILQDLGIPECSDLPF